MIYLHKILPMVFSPLILILILLLVGCIWRRWRWVQVAVVFLYLASTPLVSDQAVGFLERNTNRLEPINVNDADAVVVLSYGMYWVRTPQGYVPEWTDPDRFFAGVELYKAGKAPYLVFTRGKYPWQLGDETEGDVLKRYAETMGVPGDRILLTEEAANTEQEAYGIYKLLNPNSKIILVTSAFHMARAARLFKANGFDVQEYPVDIKIHAAKLTLMSFLPTSSALAMTQFALQECLGRMYYWLKTTNT
jgi:uncharacterized SAM-binding protein YcdF (DUF218 family)